MMKALRIFFCLMVCGMSFANSNVILMEACNLKIEEIIPMHCNEEGKIEIQVSGGEKPYLYKIDEGAFSKSNVISNLTSNDYDITVRDANGCEVTVFTHIEIPEPIIVTYELEDGTLTIDVDQIGAYEYRINDEDWKHSSIFEDVVEVNKITVRASNGCETSKTVLNEEMTNTEVFKFYPNPAKDDLFLLGTKKLKYIDILDACGKHIVSHDLNKRAMKLSISDLKSGIYLIKVIDENDRKQVKKLIVN